MKYSIEEIKKISPKTLLKLVNSAKKYLKKQDAFIDMCKEYDVDPDFIDLVPVKFGEIDVSARTERGVITLNYKLLSDGDFFKNYSYLIHEALHYLQQCYGEAPTQSADDGDYLKNPYEEEAFKKQIEFIADERGPDKADDYTEHLLDHHDKDGKERKKLKETLMEQVDE